MSKKKVASNQKTQIIRIIPYKEAAILYEKGEYLAAYNLIKSQIKKDPAPALYLLAASCLDKLGRFRDARFVLASGALLNPTNFELKKYYQIITEKINGRRINLYFNAARYPANLPSISLVLIVKNEEKDLARCLASFQDIVQEIIVVDTGSTDNTVEIARTFGARVEYYQWDDDFANARNESLKFASCDWILRTDADEYIEDVEKPKLLEAIVSGKAEIYHCDTISVLPNGREEITSNARLIKNHLGIQYNFPLHETVVPSVVRLGLTQAITNIRFRHTGYHIEFGDWGKKKERNALIVEKSLVKDPGNYFLQLLGGIFRYELQSDNVVEEMEHTLNNLPEEALSTQYLGINYINLANEYSKRKDIDKLSQLIPLLITDFIADRRMCQFIGELFLFELGGVIESNEILTFAYPLPDTEALAGTLPSENYNTNRMLELLLETSVLMSDRIKARHFLKLMTTQSKLSHKEKSTIDIDQTKELFNLERYDEVIECLKDFNHLSSEYRRLLAKAYQKTSQWQNAINNILFAATDDKLMLQDYLNMALCQMKLDRSSYAKYLLTQSRLKFPENPESYNIESLIAVNDNQLDEALELSVRAFISNTSNNAFKENLEKMSAMLNLTPVQALKVIGVKWMEQQDFKNGMYALITYSRFQPDDQDVRQLLDKMMQQV